MFSFRVIIFLSLAFSSYAFSEIAVVVNKSNSIQSLSQAQVAKIFLGKTLKFDSGERILVGEHKRGSALKKEFYTKVVGASPRKAQSQWAELVFTGKAKKPKTFFSGAAIKKWLAENSAGISYIDSKDLDDTVKVVAKFP